MKQSVRIAAAIAAASLSIGLVAGCGGSDSSASSSAADTTAAMETAAVDTTAVGTDVGMAINDACQQFETDSAAAAGAEDADALVAAFDTYTSSVTDAVATAPDDANAVAYLAAVEAANASVEAIKTDVDGGARPFADAVGRADATADEALAAAATTAGYDTCVNLHAAGELIQ